MKYFIEYNETMMPFIYDGVLPGQIIFTQSKSNIRKNIRTFGIKQDFNKLNTHFSKRDTDVIVTHMMRNGAKIQFVVVEESDIKLCPPEFIDILHNAFQLNKEMTVKDLLNFKAKEQ